MTGTKTRLHNQRVARWSRPRGGEAVGWVYVLESLEAPGVFKIGQTGAQMLTRRLSAHNSVRRDEDLGPFQIVFCVRVNDRGALEAKVHELLDEWRLGRKEWFEVELDVVMDAFRSVLGPLRSNDYCTREFADAPHVAKDNEPPLKRAMFSVHRPILLVWMIENHSRVYKAMWSQADHICREVVEMYYEDICWRPCSGQELTIKGIRGTWWRALRMVAKRGKLVKREPLK